MGKCGFMFDNRWDSGTLTASSEAVYLPKENTRHPWFKNVWRSTGVASEWLKLNKGAQSSGIKIFINRFNNFTPGATIKIQAHSSDAWGLPSVDVTIPVIDQNIMFYIWEPSIVYQWFRHTMADVANTDGYLKTGRIYLGPIFELERRYSPGGGQRAPIDPSIITESDMGQRSSIKKDKYSSFDMTWDSLPLTEFLNFYNAFISYGLTGSFFFCLDLGNPLNNLYYVRFADFQYQKNYGLYDVQISLVEER